MMIRLQVSDLLLSKTIQLVSMDWQVASDITFSNIVAASLDDQLNINSIIFDVQLDPTVKYYARSRALLSTGYTQWSNIDVFQPEETSLSTKRTYLPTNIGVPVITTDSDFTNHDLAMFKLSVSGFATNGNAVLSEVNWLITDMEGLVVWSLNVDYDDSPVSVGDLLLEHDKAYRVCCMFRANTGDVSVVVNKTFVTGSKSVMIIRTPLQTVDSAADFNIATLPHPGVTIINWEIYSVDGDGYVLVHSDTSDGNSGIALLKNTLRRLNSYVLRFKSNVDASWSYRKINTI